MTILALDVTSAFGSLAIRKNGAIVAKRTLDSPDGFAHVLYGALSDLLAQAKLELPDVDCFAAASGPGAFTGVRVGLTAIKGLAEAVGRPVCGISNLRALSTFGATGQRAVILDARRGDVFAAVYDRNAELVEQETVTKLATWLDQRSSKTIEFIVQDANILSPHHLPFAQAPRHLACAVALCAESDRDRGRWTDPAALDANYVRRSDAELFWKEI